MRTLNLKVVVRGAGEMATGVAHRLARSGFRVCLTDIAMPTAIRREVCFCEAIYEGLKEIEGLTAKRAASPAEVDLCWSEGLLPVLVDEKGETIRNLRPDVVVDAIMAKRNLGTKKGDARLVIGLGPGFRAGEDVHAVIETNRGHNLGRVIISGEAEQNTGLPGKIEGYGAERVLRAPCRGTFRACLRIGDMVKAGDAVGNVNGAPVESKISGVLRGILRDGLVVDRGFKLGDVDPRGDRKACFTISDKALAIAGGVLEAIMAHFNK